MKPYFSWWEIASSLKLAGRTRGAQSALPRKLQLILDHVELLFQEIIRASLEKVHAEEEGRQGRPGAKGVKREWD